MGKDSKLDLVAMQMGILDGKEYASLQDGRDNTEEEVTKCILLLNNQVHARSSPSPSPAPSTLPLCFLTVTATKPVSLCHQCGRQLSACSLTMSSTGAC